MARVTSSVSAAWVDSAVGSDSRSTGASTTRARRRWASVRSRGSRRRIRNDPAPTCDFSSPRRALGDHLAVVDDGHPLAQLVGLLQVLGAEQHGGAAGHQRPDDVPHLVAAAGVEAGGRLVEEQQVGGDDDAGGDVEPAPHAAGVVLHGAVGGVHEPERLEQLDRPRLRRGVGEAEQPTEQGQVLATGDLVVDRGQLPGEAHPAADLVGLGDDVVAEHRRAAGGGLQQGGEHPDGGGLAGPVRAEDAVDAAPTDREVDAVDRPRLPEPLDQAGGLDGQLRVAVHPRSVRRHRRSDGRCDPRIIALERIEVEARCSPGCEHIFTPRARMGAWSRCRAQRSRRPRVGAWRSRPSATPARPSSSCRRSPRTSRRCGSSRRSGVPSTGCPAPCGSSTTTSSAPDRPIRWRSRRRSMIGSPSWWPCSMPPASIGPGSWACRKAGWWRSPRPRPLPSGWRASSS